MIKEPYRDYATAAFRAWAAAGRPSAEVCKKEYRGAVRSDFLACDLVRAEIPAEIWEAVEEVYLTTAGERIAKGEISSRVVRYAMRHYVAERQVWERLAVARREFARRRGLRVE